MTPMLGKLNTTSGWAAIALILAWALSLLVIFYGIRYGDPYSVDGSTRLTMVMTGIPFECIRKEMLKPVAVALASIHLALFLLASITLVGLLWPPSAFMMFVAATSMEDD